LYSIFDVVTDYIIVHVVSSELYNTCSANDEFQCLGATVIATTHSYITTQKA